MYFRTPSTLKLMIKVYYMPKYTPRSTRIVKSGWRECAKILEWPTWVAAQIELLEGWSNVSESFVCDLIMPGLCSGGPGWRALMWRGQCEVVPCGKIMGPDRRCGMRRAVLAVLLLVVGCEGFLVARSGRESCTLRDSWPPRLLRSCGPDQVGRHAGATERRGKIMTRDANGNDNAE